MKKYSSRIYQIKSFIIYSLHHAEACKEFAGLISASLRQGNTAPFKEKSHQGRTVGSKVSDLIGPGFEPQTYRSRDERVTAQPTAEFIAFEINLFKQNC